MMLHVRLDEKPAATSSTKDDEIEESKTMEAEDKPKIISFTSGNPHVETLYGKLHLYRPNPPSKASKNSSTDTICLVSIPSHISPLELIEFIAAFRPKITHMRILRDQEMNRTMALIQCQTPSDAESILSCLNGKPYNSIEPDRCSIVRVASVEIRAQEEDKAGSTAIASSSSLALLPPVGTTEVPSCAVCLERLDISDSGILTTMCNHSFHCDCLYQWESSKCPVCRYSQGTIESECEQCGLREGLWICLICGHVGCGRYSSEHAMAHYHETMHTYSLELETQRVWDYAGDGYVHRLILNKQDGKFVEFPRPNGSSDIASEDAAEDQMKMEKLAVEYNFLLTSQLEEQRKYYERLLVESSEPEQQRVIAALEKENRALGKRNAAMASRVKTLDDELKFVRELNASLIANQNQLKERLADAEAKSKDNVDERVRDLESQVRDLMFYLDTQSKVDASPHKQELQDGKLHIEQGSTSSTTTTAGQNAGSAAARSKKSSGAGGKKVKK